MMKIIMLKCHLYHHHKRKPIAKVNAQPTTIYLCVDWGQFCQQTKIKRLLNRPIRRFAHIFVCASAYVETENHNDL